MVDTDKIVGAGGKPVSPPALTLSPFRLVDALWLLALMIYALAGIQLVPFHGDEAMHIYSSHDYATLFIYHQPQRLLTNPPYPVDSDQHLRLINGSINRYAIGLAWQMAGMSEDDLPRLWSWPESYQANLTAGRRPIDGLLAVARIPSAILLALSIAVVFALGGRFGKRPVAYLASALYTLNPIILVNGRRAMQEGAFLCFGLLVLLVATAVARRLHNGRQSWPWWLGLAAAGGLALAAKHSTAMFVAAAFAGVLTTGMLDRSWHRLLSTALKLAASSLVAVGLFVTLSPALWNNPPARLNDLIATRRELLQGQINSSSSFLMAPIERLAGVFTQPFLTPVQYYEASFWAEADPITAEIARYESSHLDGLYFGALLGIPLTILATLGIAAILWPRLHPPASRELTTSLPVWLAVLITAALANPLPWQRYYLQLIPLASILAGIGALTIVRLVAGHIRPGRVPITAPTRP